MNGIQWALWVVSMAALAFGFWVVGWRWWIRPLVLALRARHWAWAVAIALGAWFGGLAYLGRHTGTLTVNDGFLFAKGETIVIGPDVARVLDRKGDVLTIHMLGPRGTVRP
jgi:hypothetical protein